MDPPFSPRSSSAMNPRFHSRRFPLRSSSAMDAPFPSRSSSAMDTRFPSRSSSAMDNPPFPSLSSSTMDTRFPSRSSSAMDPPFPSRSYSAMDNPPFPSRSYSAMDNPHFPSRSYSAMDNPHFPSRSSSAMDNPPFPSRSSSAKDPPLPSRSSSLSSSPSSSSSSSPVFRALEVTLKSAHNLKEERKKIRTYANVYIHSHKKLRTRVDVVGRSSPTWNDKFVFGVSEDFLYDLSSVVKVEIYRVRRWLKDELLGTVDCPVRWILGEKNCVEGGDGEGRWKGWATIPVSRGSSGKAKGVVKVGMEVWGKGSFTIVGGCDALSWAMEYREMMDAGEIGTHPLRCIPFPH